MTAYVALLRGVNLVGKSTLKMADLKAIADELGLDIARAPTSPAATCCFSSDEPEEELSRMLEKRAAGAYGQEVRVMLRTAEEMEAVVKRQSLHRRSRGNQVQASS